MALITDKFIFIHVPKTGGQFARSVFSELQIPHEEFGDARISAILRAHYSITAVPEQMTAGKLVFGFVRHPLNWLVSRWAWQLKRMGPDSASERFAQGYRDTVAMVRPDFSEFIDLVIRYCPSAPTIEMLHRLGPKARIYKYEHLVESLEEVLLELGYEVPEGFIQKKPPNNVSGGNATFTEKQRATLLDINSVLCERFGYE